MNGFVGRRKVQTIKLNSRLTSVDVDFRCTRRFMYRILGFALLRCGLELKVNQLVYHLNNYEASSEVGNREIECGSLFRDVCF